MVILLHFITILMHCGHKSNESVLEGKFFSLIDILINYDLEETNQSRFDKKFPKYKRTRLLNFMDLFNSK